MDGARSLLNDVLLWKGGHARILREGTRFFNWKKLLFDRICALFVPHFPRFPRLSDYLQRYLPEYDDEEERRKLSHFSKEELLEMLVRAYKEKRVIAKMLGEQFDKQQRIRDILDEPLKLSQMPDVPGPDDLRKMLE